MFKRPWKKDQVRPKAPWKVIKTAFERDLKPKSLSKRYLNTGVSEQDVTPEEKLLNRLSSCALYVKVIAAEHVLAADTNNLSDPYTVVSFGGQTSSTRVERKTLSPVWDETFVFAPDIVVNSLKQGDPWIDFKLYDWDAFSKDDFLGQVVLDIMELDCQYGTKGVLELPIEGCKGEKTEVHGKLHIHVWFGENVHGVRDRSESLFCMKPRVGLLGVPKVLHCEDSVQYEEPLFSALCIKIVEVKDCAPQELYFRGNSMKSKSIRSTKKDRMLDLELELDDIEEEYEGQDEGDDDDDDIEIGDFMYCRATLGHTVHTSHLVRKQGDSAPINAMLPFVVPLPIIDRLVKVVVFRTQRTKNRGRATHVAQVPLHDILPDLGDGQWDLKQSKRSTVILKPVNTKIPEAKLTLSLAVADLDYRREFHGMSFIMQTDETLYGFMADQRTLGRFQEHTKGFTKHDMDVLAKKTADEYSKYRENAVKWESMQERAKQFIVGATERSKEKAQSWYTWAYDKAGMNSILPQNKLIEDTTIVEGAEENQEEVDVFSSIEVPKPLGLFHMKLARITLSKNSRSYQKLFCVLKFDKIWARTSVRRPDSNGVVQLDWAISFPILNPASTMALAIMATPREEKGKNALNASTLIGKLRVRISTLTSKEPISVDLEFLNERKKGGHVTGKASFNFTLSYESNKVRVSGYTKPLYPKENYVHGTISRMRELKAEQRKVIKNWLGAASPPIPESAIDAIEDVEAEEFHMSRLKTNLRRAKLALATLSKAKQHFDLVASWKYPWLSRASMVFAVFFAYHPTPVVICLLIYLSYMCYKSKPDTLGIPPGMERDEVSMSEVDDTEEKEMVKGVQLEIKSSNPYIMLKRKYDSIIRIMLHAQNALDDIATCLERLVAFVTWRDPLATTLLLCVLCIFSVILAILGPRVLMSVLFCFLIRPPRMRSPWTPPPISLFLKLPSRGERLA